MTDAEISAISQCLKHLGGLETYEEQLNALAFICRVFVERNNWTRFGEVARAFKLAPKRPEE